MRIKITEKCLELLFPSRCAVCDSVVGSGKDICPDCKRKLIFISENICMKCGKELNEREIYCYDCKGRIIGLIKIWRFFPIHSSERVYTVSNMQGGLNMPGSMPKPQF